MKEKGIEPILIEEYPEIKKHLDQFYPSLKKRIDKGFTPYNLRNCAYMEDFLQQKIVWGNLNLTASYCIAESGMYVNAPCPMIVPASKYLLGVLNSKVSDYYIRRLGVTRNGGYFEYKPMFIGELPIPIISDCQKSTFEELVDIITKKKFRNERCKEEILLNDLVYQLYQLNSEEIKFIESSNYNDY